MAAYGIMGGTFDPVHYGHLLIAERAREQYNLDRIIFVPAGLPAHKKGYNLSDAEKRWQMTSLAIESNDHFQASRIEIDRPGTSFAVDTIRSFIGQYPNQRPYFITGMDAVLEILTWHRAEELPELCEFVAATRPGSDESKCREILPDRFLKRIHFMAVPLLEISSTVIRQRVSEGKSIRYMTPDPIIDYINKEELYKHPQ